TQRHADSSAIPLAAADFAQGGLKMNSVVRPGKLFTANHAIVRKRVARVKDVTRDLIRDAVVRVIRSG
ncbi:MAG TPA: hypothetical protein VLI90_06870, partial [Tepidisphaeraceae bacterium]|nr:hypothetical protein [Tepidisphaeraceae bacterium]